MNAPADRCGRRVLLLVCAAVTITFAACLPAQARAAGTDDATFAMLWQRTVSLGSLEQDEGQSERDFLLEAAALVDALTETMAAEICGVFERRDSTTRLVLTLMTQGSPAFCMSPRADVDGAPSGALEGLSIHSHLGTRALTVHLRCHLSRGGLPGAVLGSASGRVARLAGERFTAMDLDAGPGFLVHRGRLWHQEGPGTQRFVARLPDPPAEQVERFAALPEGHGGVTTCA
jgi:hypothetical protein